MVYNIVGCIFSSSVTLLIFNFGGLTSWVMMSYVYIMV